MVLEYMFGPQSFITHSKTYNFGPRSFIIHSKKLNSGPQSLIIHQFGSNYWTTKLFNMVDGMKIAMENET